MPKRKSTNLAAAADSKPVASVAAPVTESKAAAKPAVAQTKTSAPTTPAPKSAIATESTPVAVPATPSDVTESKKKRKRVRSSQKKPRETKEDLEVQRALAHAARLRQVSAAKAGKPAATVESVQPRKRKHVEEKSDAEDDDEESDEEDEENQSYGLTEEEAERLFADIHSDDEELPSKDKKKFDVKTVKTTDGVADADSIRTNKKANQHKDDDRTGRTIFVGNVPITVTPKALKAVFRPFGAVESVRFRSVAFDTTGVPRKVAFIQKKFHAERDSMNAYVVFIEAAGATAALAFNGKEIEGKVVRVDLADNSKKHEDDKSVFVGSLPFDCTDDELRAHFTPCGTIASIRVIRDKATNVGKGFGFVCFEDTASVKTAVSLHHSNLKGKQLRVFKSGTDAMKKWANNKAKKTEKPSSAVRGTYMPKKRGDRESALLVDSSSFQGRTAKPTLQSTAAATSAATGAPTKVSKSGKVLMLNGAGKWKKPRKVPRTTASTAAQSERPSKKTKHNK